MADPYRSPSTEACPACATPLLAADDGLRPCPKQCGAWAPIAAITRLWGDVIFAKSEPRLRWTGGKPFACVTCREPTRRHMQPQCTWYVCGDHGAWFHKDSRAAFEQLFAGEIERYRSSRAEVDVLAALLRQAIAGDPQAAHQLAQRWVALERQVFALHDRPRPAL